MMMKAAAEQQVSRVFQKLNYKAHRRVMLVNVPPEFKPHMEGLEEVEIRQTCTVGDGVLFFVYFVTTKEEIDRYAEEVSSKTTGDIVLWFAYPKRTSRLSLGRLSRDRGWERLERAGFDTVRQIAIDEDWTALRFRRVMYMKRLGK